MRGTEHQIQNVILQYLGLMNRRGDWYGIRNNSYSGFIERGNSRGYVKSGNPGSPDIMGCYKGRFVGIEVKSPTGRQSPAQIEVQKEIEKAGGLYILARDLDDVIKIFEKEPVKIFYNGTPVSSVQTI